MLDRAGLTAAVCAAAVLGGVAAATAITPGLSPAPPPPDADRAQPGTARIGARARAQDGGPDFAVRSYTGRSGLSCLTLARTDGQSFGPPLADGKVRDIPVDGSGSCGDPELDRLQLFAETRATDSGRSSAVFGRAGRDVVALKVRETAQNDLETVQLAGDRTFIRPTGRGVDPLSVRLVAEMSDGTSRTFSLAGP